MFYRATMHSVFKVIERQGWIDCDLPVSRSNQKMAGTIRLMLHHGHFKEVDVPLVNVFSGDETASRKLLLSHEGCRVFHTVGFQNAFEHNTGWDGWSEHKEHIAFEMVMIAPTRRRILEDWCFENDVCAAPMRISIGQVNEISILVEKKNIVKFQLRWC